MPWEELLFRDRRSGADLSPPRTQVILLHPSVAVEVSGPEFRRWQRLDALSLELLGRIWYRNDYRTHSGASLMLTTAKDVGIGAGVLIHFSPTLKAGYVYGLQKQPERRNGAVMSVDLYKYLEDRKTKLDDVLQNIQKRLGSN
jgi:hypothetical protein